jgi:sensor histidine kinase YesM
MTTRLARSKVLNFWVLNAVGWLLYTFSFFSVYYTGKWNETGVIVGALAIFVFGFLSCVILRHIYLRINFANRSVISVALLIGVVSFLVAHIWLALEVLTNFILHGSDSQVFQVFFKIYLGIILFRGMLLMGWTVLYLGIKLWLEWKEEEKNLEKASDLAQSAQLQMLRYQLNPHFLFNALNSIRALVDEDEGRAREMVTELSEFLRYSLHSKSFADVPLKEEIEAIRHYFAIQKKRYEDKLEVVYDIASEADDYPVLSFLIHPLVENAVKYGMQTSSMPLRITLAAAVDEGDLKLEICNTGAWVEPAAGNEQNSGGTGTGLENVRQRLDNAFPNRYAFHICEEEGRVCIRLIIYAEMRRGHAEAVECVDHR